jgi:hypothetical protein
MKYLHIVLISLLSTIIFGLVDASLFLLGEKTVQTFLHTHLGLTSTLAELATGGLSASLSIFISSFIANYLKKSKYKIIENPAIDALGFILGTIFIMYIVYNFQY